MLVASLRPIAQPAVLFSKAQTSLSLSIIIDDSAATVTMAITAAVAALLLLIR